MEIAINREPEKAWPVVPELLPVVAETVLPPPGSDNDLAALELWLSEHAGLLRPGKTVMAINISQTDHERTSFRRRSRG